MKSDLGNKNIMAANIRYYLEANNMKRKDLCDALGFKYSTVTAWLNAEKYPRIDKIEMMANYFRISKSDLVERQSESPAKNLVLTDREREHLERYRALTEEHREAVDVQLNFFYEKDARRVEIPVSSESEREKLHRLLDEAITKEKKGARVSSYGSSAMGSK